MTMTQHVATKPEPVVVSVARQAIFDRKRRLWGYELFCVGNSEKSTSGLPVDEDVAISIASSAGIGLKQMNARKKRIVIKLTEKGILDAQVFVLPPERTTVQVSEEVYRTESASEHVGQLKAAGFQIEVSGYSGAADCESLYDIADIIGVDVRQFSAVEKTAFVATVRKRGATPLASMVDDPATFTVCSELGFELFQGSFSKAPEIVPLRKLSSNQVTRFQLLQLIEAENPDLQQLAEKIQSDAAISFRLLSYLNSSTFCFAQKIKSINHAVSMLGWTKIKNWLRIVLLSDISTGDESSELLLTSAQRAKFLELIADRYPFWGFEPESLHMLGLFSLLDAMIGIPMAEIVTYLPMDGKLKSALCQESNNEYLPMLTLARHFEEARWPEIQSLTQQLNIDEVGARAAFQEAVDWAAELSNMIDEE
jgi:c-di-GMP phosphodiesterase